MKVRIDHPTKMQLPEGRYVAFTLGPESDFDQIIVNGRVVAVDRITPVETFEGSVEIKMGRGLTSAPSSWVAHLVAFECWDEVRRLGPRPNKVYRELRLAVTPDDAVDDGGGFVFPVPFFGRTHARVRITPHNGDQPAEFVVAGVSHLTGVKLGGESDLATIIGTPYGGAELIGTFDSPEATAAPDATTHTDHEITLGTGAHIGGTDSSEMCEALLVVYGHGGITTDIDILVEVEVGGEHGVTA